MDRVFTFIALASTLAALVAYTMTYIVGDVDAYPEIGYLVLPVLGFFALIAFSKYGQRTFRAVGRVAPRLERVLLFLFLFGLLNMAAFIVFSGAAFPEVRDSRYVMVRQREVVQEISKSEYLQQRRYSMRATTAMLALLNFWPAVFFHVKRKLRVEGS